MLALANLELEGTVFSIRSFRQFAAMLSAEKEARFSESFALTRILSGSLFRLLAIPEAKV